MPYTSHVTRTYRDCLLVSSENITLDIKTCSQKDSVSDEELFEALNVCVSNETERLQKFASRLTPKVNAVQDPGAERVKEGRK